MEEFGKEEKDENEQEERKELEAVKMKEWIREVE